MNDGKRALKIPHLQLENCIINVSKTQQGTKLSIDISLQCFPVGIVENFLCFFKRFHILFFPPMIGIKTVMGMSEFAVRIHVWFFHPLHLYPLEQGHYGSIAPSVSLKTQHSLIPYETVAWHVCV